MKTTTAMAIVMNKIYKMMEDLTIEQIKEMRDVRGHRILLDLGTEAYARYIHQCNYMLDKKQQEAA